MSLEVKLTAPVNKIIPFSSVDGPGNRTAVFLQGCNFDCKYCHNPETRNLCVNCMACVSKCPTGALSEKAGKVTAICVKIGESVMEDDPLVVIE
jgi:pyruvate-formate lyase-activating enzyme